MEICILEPSVPGPYPDTSRNHLLVHPFPHARGPREGRVGKGQSQTEVCVP